jgi:cardiolipin synthase
MGIGNAETDAFAYESAGLKSYIKTTTQNPESTSFRFLDYSKLRARLADEGVLPPTPKGVSPGQVAGLWKYALTFNGGRLDGVLEVRRSREGGGYDVTGIPNAGNPGGRWDAHAVLVGPVFTVRRRLTAGVTGVLAGAPAADGLEYVATLNGPDTADVETYLVSAGTRTRVGGGQLSRPPYFNRNRDKIDQALSKGDAAIIALDDAAIAAASPDEKVAMIEVLMNHGNAHFPTVRALDPFPVRKSRQDAILRILESEKTDAGFDRVYYGLSPDRLLSALTGKDDERLRELVAKHRAGAKPGDWAGYLKYLDQVTGCATSGKNDVAFLVDGAKVIPVALAEINAAKESINLSVFQWEGDDTGFKLANVVAQKARDGVRVRVLLDSQGTGHSDKVEEMIDLMRRAGVEVVVTPAPLLASHLDHRKVLVIDGKVGFTGGMNIGDDYQIKWHDQQTLLKGPVVAKLQDAFLSRWLAAGGTPPLAGENLYPPLPEPKDGIEMRIVTHEGGGADRNIKASYLRAIGTAQQSIKIATPYFSDAAIIDALCAAARRGVQVQVVLPRQNDQAIMRKTARAFYGELLEAGVEVYEYLPRMAHEKVAVIDGIWCTAGSSNLDPRSLEFNDELNYVVLDRRLAETIDRELFQVDVPQSERITQAPRSVLNGVLRGTASWL